MELYIEKQKVDINDELSTLLTLAIDDIKDFGAKNTSFTKTGVMYGTKNNNKVLGNIFNITSSISYSSVSPNVNYNFNVAVGASCYIFSENIQIFKGVFRLLEIIDDNGVIQYEYFLTGELGGFVAKMGNKKLTDLDFSSHDHTYSIANITGSWANDNAGNGYYYPLIDYGTYSSNKKDWKYGTFRPSLFAKEYIEKIFTAAGYSFDCDLFSTDRFKRIIVPHSQKLLQKNSSILGGGNRTNNYTCLDDAIGSAATIDLETFTAGLFTANAGKDEFTYTGAPTITTYIDFHFEGDYICDSDLYFEITKNGTNVYLDTIPFVGLGIFTPVTYSRTYTAIPVTVSTGDIIRFGVGSTAIVTETYRLDVSAATLSFSSAVAVLNPISIGGDVVINDCIPQNILQKDFLSSIIKLFNLYVFEDYEFDKVLKIKPFVDYYLDATSVDWSNKIDRSKPIRYVPMSELNSRYFEYNFKSDSDYYNDIYKKAYNECYGNYKYDSEFEFANESTKIELVFSGTPLVGYVGEDKVYSTIFKRTGETTGSGEEKIDSNIRLLLAKKITGVASWKIYDTDGVTVLNTGTDYGYAGHLDDPDAPANDLQFGVPKELYFTLSSGALNVNQFNVYWSSYMAEITDKDSRLLIATARLNDKDIYQLDFSKLIYVDGVLYRLNKISDFNINSSDVCKIELLKVINKIY